MEEKNLRTTSFRQIPLEKKVNCSFVGNWRIFPRSSISIRSKCYHFDVTNWENRSDPSTLLSKSKWLCCGKVSRRHKFFRNFQNKFQIGFSIHTSQIVPFFIYSDFKLIFRLFDIWHGDREQLLHGDAWPQGSALPGAGGDNDGADATRTYYNFFKVGVWQIRKAKKL